jgi:hypothetical protein
MKYLIIIITLFSISLKGLSQIVILKQEKEIPALVNIELTNMDNVVISRKKQLIKLFPNEVYSIFDSNKNNYIIEVNDPELLYFNSKKCQWYNCQTHALTTIPKSKFIFLDSAKEERKLKVTFSVLNKMEKLFYQFKPYYDKMENDTIENEVPQIDVIFYQYSYKIVEKILSDYCISNTDTEIYQKMIRINLGPYFYDGDSGEGYFTFGKLFFKKPEMMVLVYNKSNDESLKIDIKNRLLNNSQWKYTLSYWFYFIVDRNKKLFDIYQQVHEKNIEYSLYENAVKEEYTPFLRQMGINDNFPVSN